MKHRIFSRPAFLLVAAFALILSGCQKASAATVWAELSPTAQMPLETAQQFSVQEYAEGYRLITVNNAVQYLVVPEGAAVPGQLPAEMVVLQQPLDNIYLTATAVMDFFRALDGIASVRLSGTDADGWYIPEAKQALQSGKMLYAGKYSAPDYEGILEQGCTLAVESTMIYHSPEVKEQLESLGVPVFVDYSSYEENPLGRMEWIKLYGILLGKEEQAAARYDEAVAALAPVLEQKNTGKTVAFFYISSTGTANVRKSGDYLSKMIALAGGNYLPANLGDNGNNLSTLNMDLESFYAATKDADILIYNSTVDGELQTVEQLIAKCPLLADFKAVQSGDVWCTGKNMFQETMGLGNMILDFHAVFSEKDPKELQYLYRLQ